MYASVRHHHEIERMNSSIIPKVSLCNQSLPPAPPPTAQATTNLLSATINSSVGPRIFYHGIVQCVVFVGWVLTLSLSVLRFLCATGCINSVSLAILRFVSSFTCWWTFRLCPVAVTNGAARSIRIPVPVWTRTRSPIASRVCAELFKEMPRSFPADQFAFTATSNTEPSSVPVPNGSHAEATPARVVSMCTSPRHE